MSEICEIRRKNYRSLETFIRNVPGLSVLPTPDDCDRGGFFRFVLHVDRLLFAGMNTTQIVAAVQEEGAKTVTPGSLARCLHTYQIFQDQAVSPFGQKWRRGADPLADRPVYKMGDFPNAEEFAATTIQMPAFAEPSEELIRQYAHAFAKVQAHAEKLKQLD